MKKTQEPPLFPVAISAHVKGRDIDLAVATALDVGISRWCAEAHVEGPWPEGADMPADVISRGGLIALQHEETEAPTVLSRERFLAGLARAVAEGVVTLGPGWAEEITPAQADAIVQFGVFGRVRYE